MNKDQVKGAIGIVAGAAKQAVGKVIGSDEVLAAGTHQRSEGSALKSEGDVRAMKPEGETIKGASHWPTDPARRGENRPVTSDRNSELKPKE